MRTKNKYGYLFFAPFFIIFILFQLIPAGITFFYTFTKTDGYSKAVMVGLDNWARILQDKLFFNAIRNTFQMWIITFIVEFIIVIFLIMVFSDIKWKLKKLNVFRALFYLPSLLTLVSIAAFFANILDPQQGIFNHFLMNTGIINKPIDFLFNPKYSQISLSLIQAWLWFGSSFLFLMAGVQGISKDYYESARVDGANRFQTLIAVTLPSIKPVMLYVVVTSIISGMQLYEIPQILLGTFPYSPFDTMSLRMVSTAFQWHQFGYGATMAYVIFIFTFLLSFITYKLMYKNHKDGAY